MIDTHSHLDGKEFKDDLDATIQRARHAGVERIFLPAIDVSTCHTVIAVTRAYPDFVRPMFGIHPEEVKSDWHQQLCEVRKIIDNALCEKDSRLRPIAIGEVGLDFYWSREFEKEQLLAFEEQVQWSVDTGLPLMIHCRKAQNELLNILRKYKNKLPGGIFHCFTGNEIEAAQLLEFENFALGIGGVLTFKKSNLPTTLHNVVPLERIVLETDSPYMAPVPHRGQRNESAYVSLVMSKLAEVYNVTPKDVEVTTNTTVKRIFVNT